MANYKVNTESLAKRYNQNPRSILFASYAEALLKEEKIVEAISICQSGLGFVPDYITGHLVLARCYMEGARWEESIDAYKAALALDRRCPGALKALGELYRKLQNEDQAAAYYNAYLDVNPFDREIRRLIDRYLEQGTFGFRPKGTESEAQQAEIEQIGRTDNAPGQPKSSDTLQSQNPNVQKVASPLPKSDAPESLQASSNLKSAPVDSPVSSLDLSEEELDMLSKIHSDPLAKPDITPLPEGVSPESTSSLPEAVDILPEDLEARLNELETQKLDLSGSGSNLMDGPAIKQEDSVELTEEALLSSVESTQNTDVSASDLDSLDSLSSQTPRDLAQSDQQLLSTEASSYAQEEVEERENDQLAPEKPLEDELAGAFDTIFNAESNPDSQQNPNRAPSDNTQNKISFSGQDTDFEQTLPLPPLDSEEELPVADVLASLEELQLGISPMQASLKPEDVSESAGGDDEATVALSEDLIDLALDPRNQSKKITDRLPVITEEFSLSDSTAQFASQENPANVESSTLAESDTQVEPSTSEILDQTEGSGSAENFVVPTTPGNVATATLAELYFKQGLKEQAIEIYGKLLQREPENENIALRIEAIEASMQEDLSPDNRARRNDHRRNQRNTTSFNKKRKY